MKYLAILFAVESGGGQSFTMSREVDTDDLTIIYPLLKNEALVTDDDIADILLVANGDPCPEVVKHWGAENGDFQGLDGMTDEEEESLDNEEDGEDA